MSPFIIVILVVVGLPVLAWFFLLLSAARFGVKSRKFGNKG